MLLFREKCASCHSYLDGKGKGISGPKSDGTPNGAPNLYKFASRDWIRGLIDPEKIVSEHYFGRTQHGAKEDGEYPTGGMVEFVRTTLPELDADPKALEEAIIAISAEAQLPAQRKADAEAASNGAIARGKEAVITTFSCTDCHKYHDDGDLGTAPDLTGYGSFEWLVLMISNPEHERLYQAGNDRMPAFGATKELSEKQIEFLAHWLRGDALELHSGK